MKRITFVIVAAFIAVFSYAQSPKVVSGRTISKQLFSGVKAMNKVKAPRKAESDFPILYDAPGEKKIYTRAGESAVLNGQSVSLVEQEGKIVVSFDGNDVYFKDLVSGYQGAIWVKGTLSEDGTTITLPLFQNVYYHSEYDASLMIAVAKTEGQSYVVNNDITEVTFTVDENTITLNGCDSQDNQLGLFWSDDNTWQGYGDWNSVYTLTDEVYEEPTLVEVPEGLETSTWNFKGARYNAGSVAYNVKVGFDGNDVYVQGMAGEYLPEAWIKGVRSGNNVTFEKGQFLGKNNGEFYFGGTDGSNFTDANFTINAEENELTLAANTFILVNGKPDEMYFYAAYSDVVITKGAPDAPTNVVVTDITTNSANVAWTAGTNDNMWNLRYREYVEMNSRTWDFEDGGDGWITIDADGDGKTWMTVERDGNHMMFSASYDNNDGALTPDNWLISPEVTLGGELSFNAWGQDPNYAAEHFAVYVCTGEDPANVDDYVEVMPETVVSGDVQNYTVDLSAYDGQKGYIAFRHFNITDQFILNLDDIVLNIPNEDGKTPGEWTVVENVTENPYALTGLAADTQYEVQVQTVGDGQESKWTPSTIFKTLVDPASINGVEEVDNAAEMWYNINGMKLAGKPVQKGMYIKNGKKVVVE